MKRYALGAAVGLLVALAVYSVFAGVRAAFTAKGYDPGVFWTAEGTLFVIAAVAVWGAARVYRRNFVKSS